MACVCLCVCICAYVCVLYSIYVIEHMYMRVCPFECAYVRPEVDFIYFILCSLLNFLRQNLSVNLKLCISARLPGQESLRICRSLYSQRRAYSHVPAYLEFSRLGQESGSHACVNISPTESYSIPMANSLTNGG